MQRRVGMTIARFRVLTRLASLLPVGVQKLSTVGATRDMAEAMESLGWVTLIREQRASGACGRANVWTVVAAMSITEAGKDEMKKASW